MDSNIQDRLQRAIDAICGGNKSEFCRRIGKDVSSLKDIIGGKRSAPGYPLLYAILSSDLGISPKWLMAGEGEMLTSTTPTPPPSPSAHSLPLIPAEAFAGPGLPSYDDERIEDFYTVSEFKNSDFLIRVKGDSMVPKYNGGDIVACKKVALDNLYFLQWNRAYVILTRSQGIMIKRVHPSEKDGYIKCVSDNTEYAPFDVPTDDIIQIALVNGAITLD